MDPPIAPNTYDQAVERVLFPACAKKMLMGVSSVSAD
jgi:hypothetical protein